MQNASTFVGLDVHKNTISVALLRPGQPPLEWSLVNDTGGVCRLIRKLERESGGELRCCYEAGPTGFVLYRRLRRTGRSRRCAASTASTLSPRSRWSPRSTLRGGSPIRAS
jgi:hypothetical protein